MGQKVNPNGLRIGPNLIRTWSSIFYANNDYASLLAQDLNIRKLIHERCKLAQVSNILIHRTSKSVTIAIYVKKPGVVLGKGGGDVEKLKSSIVKITNCDIRIDVHEVKRPDADPNLVAQDIAMQLKRNVPVSRAIAKVLMPKHSNVRGVKIICSGRIGGVEIARSEPYTRGSMPLSTFRANITYGFCEAVTTYGVIGVKVWIYSDDVDLHKRKVS